MPEPAATEDGFSNAPFPGSAAFDKLQAEADAATDNAPKADAPKADDTPPEPQEPNAGMPTAEQELAAIRAEGLTGTPVAHGAPHRAETRACAKFRFRRRPSSPPTRGRSLRARRQAGTCGRHGPASRRRRGRSGRWRCAILCHSLPAMPRTTQPAAPRPQCHNPAGRHSPSVPMTAPPRS
jgi:hypothetical protein